MKVAVLCEFSGRVRDAFTAAGHEAMSCDLLPSKTPGTHFIGDCRDLDLSGYDLVIAHPPCTHLACSGNRHKAAKKADGRWQEAVDFFMWFTKLENPWAIENPVGDMSRVYRKPDQITQPWQFGDPYQKTTCLWLNRLPKLIPTKIVDRGEFVTFPSGKKMPKWYSNLSGNPSARSETFPGIAKAMAQQWGI